MKIEKNVICCDWGTTSLRTRLVNVNSYESIDQESSNQGSSVLFERWKQVNSIQNSDDRIYHYLEELNVHLDVLANRNHLPLEGLPVIISGMASSSVGLMELPYAALPFPIGGEQAIVKRLPATERFNHPIVLISGVRDGAEVMRGEETQLVGIAEFLAARGRVGEMTVVMPGTHSKHVGVRNQAIASIATYITGELFDNLTTKGLLKESVHPTDDGAPIDHWEGFDMGVEDSEKADVLNTLFKVRTNRLFNRLTERENYQYLSGLLIGHEIRHLKGLAGTPIIVCSSAQLYPRYERAISHMMIENVCHIDPSDVELATVMGQLTIAKHYLVGHYVRI